MCKQCVSLSFLSFVSDKWRETKGALKAVDLHNCWDTTSWSREEGKKEVHAFVLGVFRELMDLDTGAQGGSASSMAAFTRIDVGIMMDEEGSAKYFVNEVERTPNTSLWLTHLEKEKYPMIAHSFAHGLRRCLWFCDFFKSYAEG